MTMTIKNLRLALLIGLATLSCACSVAVPHAQIDESGQYKKYDLPYGAGTLQVSANSEVEFHSNGQELIGVAAITSQDKKYGVAFIHINPLDYDAMFYEIVDELAKDTNAGLDELLTTTGYVPGVYPATYNEIFLSVAKALGSEPDTLKRLVLQDIADENYEQDYYSSYELIKVNFNSNEEYIIKLVYSPGSGASKPGNEPDYYWVYKILYCGRDYKLLLSARILPGEPFEEEFLKFLNGFQLN